MRNLALFSLLGLLSSPALAQNQHFVDIHTQIATITGGLHLVAEKCEHYSPAQVAAQKQAQQQNAAAVGLSVPEYTRLYQDAHNQALARWSMATQAERDKSCAMARLMLDRSP